MKLELKHLAPYLPYGLKVINKHQNSISKVYSKIDGVDFGVDESPVEMFKLNTMWVIERVYIPILRPLSDLTKEIEVDGDKFVPITELLKPDINLEAGNYTLRHIGTTILANDIILINTENLSLKYEKFQKLFEWHFDVFGLIEKGLAINKNTL